jgi:hypothetical protein
MDRSTLATNNYAFVFDAFAIEHMPNDKQLFREDCLELGNEGADVGQDHRQ